MFHVGYIFDIIKPMAANQELKNYIVEQTKLGVSKEVVKSALLEAGWKEDDINQAIAEVQQVSRGATSFHQVSPIQPAQQTQPFQPVKPAEISQTSKPANMSGLSSLATKDSPVSFVTSDIFKSKEESIFQPSGAKNQTSPNSQEVKPQAISITQNNKTGTGMRGKILPISLGVLSIILLGGNVYFFLQNGNLDSKLVSLNSGKASSDSQIASLTADEKNLNEQVILLNRIITDLDNQLMIFAMPQAGSTSTEVAFSINGMLRGGGKLPYDVVTNKNVVMHIKNSKDADVDAILKTLTIGTQVSVEGTHQAESNQLMVTTVNGKPVLGAAKIAAAAAQVITTASSTDKARTTNP